jgi:glycyl-tRNA synthetase beta chain
VARSAGGGAAAPAIANAIRDHYKPQGPSDAVPTEPVSVAVALADKLDTLAGFFVIEEKPTGSGDPYALRRAALGIVRLAIENGARFSLLKFIQSTSDEALEQKRYQLTKKYRAASSKLGILPGSNEQSQAEEFAVAAQVARPMLRSHFLIIAREVSAFILDRLRVLLRDQGKRHDLIEAAIAVADDDIVRVAARADDDIVRIVARLDALDAFLKTDAGANLIAGLKRAANILRAEEKKGALPENLQIDVAHLSQGEEQALYQALDVAEQDVDAALQREDFGGAMTALAQVRGAVDAFFETVVVNADEADLRRNRLALLAGLKRTADRIADFSRIEG